jgi:CheY-like chemotaxis protein
MATVQSPGIGQGATITIELPLASSSDETRDWDTGLAGRTTRRILIIEDNPDAAETLRDLLELWGHQVDVALSGFAGLQAAETLNPDVVLCDIGLPEIDGFEVGRRLRRSPITAQSYLVAVTGYGQEQDRERTAEAGFDCHLVKPVNLEELKALLSQSSQRQGNASG